MEKHSSKSSEGQNKLADIGKKRFVFRWTPPKGFTAKALFFVLAFFFEFFLVYSFLSLGLVDKNVWTVAFQVPAANWVFTVSVSLLFHFFPIAVIVVLVSSWAYLTRYFALGPARAEGAKRSLLLSRREQERRRFRVLRRFFKRVGKRLERFDRAIRAGFERVPGVSYISKRLYYARAAVRSAVAVFAVFVSLFLLLLVVAFPGFVYHGVVGLYMGNPSFLGFVKGTTGLVQGLGEALPPIGELGYALVEAAPGFRSSFAGVGASLTESIVGLDVVGKYVLCQSFAALVSALVALFYGMFVSSRRVRRR